MTPDRTFADLLVDGHRILPALLDDLEAAEREIHFSVFLFFRDPSSTTTPATWRPASPCTST